MAGERPGVPFSTWLVVCAVLMAAGIWMFDDLYMAVSVEVAGDPTLRPLGGVGGYPTPWPPAAASAAARTDVFGWPAPSSPSPRAASPRPTPSPTPRPTPTPTPPPQIAGPPAPDPALAVLRTVTQDLEVTGFSLRGASKEVLVRSRASKRRTLLRLGEPVLAGPVRLVDIKAQTPRRIRLTFEIAAQSGTEPIREDVAVSLAP